MDKSEISFYYILSQLSLLQPESNTQLDIPCGKRYPDVTHERDFGDFRREHIAI